jgi:hypothetical protein
MSMSPSLNNAESVSTPIVRFHPEVPAQTAHTPPIADRMDYSADWPRALFW